ncbi:hypothetical protein ACQPYK_49640 (plasmid) [Streptosporangium sp. CA-135522]|uniref:hypothetical protein n=1 Tax=Streptosporangium sp. CA-135522 TaxID=3240072 RepID=UPI003D9069C6
MDAALCWRKRAERAEAELVQQAEPHEDLLASIWLYIDWRDVTRQLTTEQKNLFADAVEAFSLRRDDEPPDAPLTVDRWWHSDQEKLRANTS